MFVVVSLLVLCEPLIISLVFVLEQDVTVHMYVTVCS